MSRPTGVFARPRGLEGAWPVVFVVAAVLGGGAAVGVTWPSADRLFSALTLALGVVVALMYVALATAITLARLRARRRPTDPPSSLPRARETERQMERSGA